MTRGRIWSPERRRSSRIRSGVARHLNGREPTNKVIEELRQMSPIWFGEQLTEAEIRAAAITHKRLAEAFAQRAIERKSRGTCATESPCRCGSSPPRPTTPGPGTHSPGSGVP